MMRYGHQSLSEIKAMPMDEFLRLFEALMDLITEENKAGVIERG